MSDSSLKLSPTGGLSEELHIQNDSVIGHVNSTKWELNSFQNKSKYPNPPYKGFRFFGLFWRGIKPAFQPHKYGMCISEKNKNCFRMTYLRSALIISLTLEYQPLSGISSSFSYLWVYCDLSSEKYQIVDYCTFIIKHIFKSTMHFSSYRVISQQFDNFFLH